MFQAIFVPWPARVTSPSREEWLGPHFACDSILAGRAWGPDCRCMPGERQALQPVLQSCGALPAGLQGGGIQNGPSLRRQRGLEPDGCALESSGREPSPGLVASFDCRFRSSPGGQLAPSMESGNEASMCDEVPHAPFVEAVEADGEMRLRHRVTGEMIPLPSAAELAFDENGYAFVASEDGGTEWAASLFTKALHIDQSGRWFIYDKSIAGTALMTPADLRFTPFYPCLQAGAGGAALRREVLLGPVAHRALADVVAIAGLLPAVGCDIHLGCQ